MDLKTKLTIATIVPVLLITAFLIVGIGAVIGLGAWIWMSFGIRQALSGRTSEERERTLSIYEGDLV